MQEGFRVRGEGLSRRELARPFPFPVFRLRSAEGAGREPVDVRWAGKVLGREEGLLDRAGPQDLAAPRQESGGARGEHSEAAQPGRIQVRRAAPHGEDPVHGPGAETRHPEERLAIRGGRLDREIARGGRAPTRASGPSPAGGSRRSSTRARPDRTRSPGGGGPPGRGGFPEGGASRRRPPSACPRSVGTPRSAGDGGSPRARDRDWCSGSRGRIPSRSRPRTARSRRRRSPGRSAADLP